MEMRISGPVSLQPFTSYTCLSQCCVLTKPTILISDGHLQKQWLNVPDYQTLK